MKRRFGGHCNSVRLRSFTAGTDGSLRAARSLIIVKFEDDDICVPIFGMGRVVEISRVVEINMTPAVLHEIQQRAHKENVSLGQAFTTLVKRAIKSDLNRVALGRGQ